MEDSELQIHPKLAEFKKDKDKLMSAFDEFSEKYGEDIICFQIYKMKGYCWKLVEVTMDGKFLR